MTTIGYARTRPVNDTAAVRVELAAAGCTAVFIDEQVSIRADWPQFGRALCTNNSTPPNTASTCYG